MRSIGWFKTFLALALMVPFSQGCDDDGAPTLPPRSDMGASVDSVQITQPLAGTALSLADDLDNDLSNGIQFTVVLDIEVAGEGTLQLNVADGMPETKPAVTGEVSFDATLPADRNGTYAVTATLSPNDGDVVTATVNVTVQAVTCTVEIEPQPTGAGCDLGASADEDQDTPGLQTTLTARSNCPEVTFKVNNLPPVTQNTADGTTSLRVTLIDGENNITVSATDGVSEPAVIGPYPLVARLTGPRIEANGLNENRTNGYWLADGEIEGGIVYWTIRGRAIGVAPGQNVQVALEPALDNTPTEVRVDENGDFRLELAVARGEYYAGNLNLSGLDTCGESGSSPTYVISLDAVIPTLRITEPNDGALLVYDMDVDPLRAGAQIPVPVEIVDPRPASVDYAVSVECASVGGNSSFVDRARGAGDRLARATLLDGDANNDQVLVTFQQSEVGEFICRAVLIGESNPGTATEVVWRAFFERPNFTVFSPARAPSCISTDEVDIAGIGGDLDGNDASLNVTLTAQGAAPGEETRIALEPRGNERYGVNLNSQALPDGRYQVAVTGQVLGQVDVAIDPAQFEITVDRVPPSVAILSPAADGIFTDDAPAVAGTQSILTFEVCGAAGRTLQVDTLPALAGSPFALQVPEGDGCAQVQIPAVTVPLGDVTINAQVTDSCGVLAEQSRVAAIPPDAREARITSPVAGDLNGSVDTDGARLGCQFELEAIGQGLAEGAEFHVCTDVNQAAPSEACNGRASALAGVCRIVGSTANGTRVICPVSLQDGAHQVSFVGIFGERIESAPIALNVDCQAPTVQALTIVEDANQDGCINAIERQNSGDVANAARMTIRIQTEGMEDGRTVRVLTEDGTSRGSVAIIDNQGDVTIDLPDGSRTLSVDGSDAVGNPLPTQGAGLVTVPVQVDTVAPSPTLTNLAEATCLNAAADEDGGAAGLQYGIQITTGRDVGQTVTARLSIDGGQAISVESAADTLGFPQVPMDEGAHSVSVTVADACANMGSVNGFAQVGGQDDWTQPLPVSIRVDTVAPTLAILGLQAGTVLTGPDDADGNSANGFQVDLAAEVTPNVGLEAGQTIDVTINGAPAITEPSPVIVPENSVGPIPVRADLAPGMQSIRLATADTCGNVAESDAIDVELDIPGCASAIDSFAGNPQILGPADGIRSGNELTIAVGGTVQLLDAACVGAPIQLLVDDVEFAAGLVPAGGQVLFENVTLTEGARNVRFRVGPVADNTLDSANQTLLVDLASPSVVVNQPADGAVVLTDSAPGIDGQQAIVQVSVSEAPVVTSRTAILRVDGAQVGGEIVVPDGSPTQVTFSDVTLAAGVRTLQLCTSDGAGNTGCAQWTVNADPSAPAGVADLTVQIIDSRSTEVALGFTAPGDDGNDGGPVVQYAIRRADAPIADETAWQNAAGTELIVPATSAPGAAESITISGVGPGPLLADGLQQNQVHDLSIRAMDDAGRMGPLVQTIVDLTMPTNVVDIPATTGAYDDSAFFNQGSMVVGVGDVDNEGTDDALVIGAQGSGSTANLVLGVQAGDDPTVVALQLPANILPAFYGLGGASLGDVNGDGINDYAVIGVQPGFAGSAIVLYFGCNGCGNAELAAPDALILANGNRLFSVVSSAGNFNQRAGDAVPMNDIFLGGTIAAPANPTTAFIVAGRSNWPLLPDVLVVDDDPALGGEGITVLSVPDGKAGYAGTGVGDLDGDGSDDLVFSAGTPSVVYRFNGGVDLPDSITYAPNNPDTVIVTHVCSNVIDGFGEHIIGGLDLDGDGQNRPNFVISDGINRRVIVFDETDQPVDCFGRSRSLFGNVVDFAGDVDGDGFTDLIVSHSGEQADAHVFYNDGMGRFGDGAAEAPREAHIILDQPALPKLSVAGLGDMNGDGRADIGALVKQPGGNLELVIYY